MNSSDQKLKEGFLILVLGFFLSDLRLSEGTLVSLDEKTSFKLYIYTYTHTYMYTRFLKFFYWEINNMIPGDFFRYFTVILPSFFCISLSLFSSFIRSASFLIAMIRSLVFWYSVFVYICLLKIGSHSVVHSGPHFVEQAVLAVTEMCLPLLLKYWDKKWVPLGLIF